MLSLLVAVIVVAGSVVLTRGAYAGGESLVRVQYDDKTFLYTLSD